MMRPSRLLVTGWLFLPVFLFTACQGTEPVAQAPTATLAPIVSMTPRFTATPLSSRTPLPTFTYTPSISPIPPTASNTPTPTEIPPVLGIIQSRETVNIREGPGTAYSAFTALTPGTGVEVLGQSPDGNWLNIRMDDGSEGWVSTRLVFVQPTVTPPPTLTATVDTTAIALGTVFPTALFGGLPVTPTPPLAFSPTPVGAAEATDAVDLDATAEAASGDAVVNNSALDQTATALALVSSITGGTPAAANATGGAPVGGPTGGPLVPTGTRAAGQGAQGSGATDQQGVDVSATCDATTDGISAPTSLRAGATIDVYWWWFARTPEQIRDHIDNAIYDVRINNTPLANWRQYAAALEQRDNGDYWQYWYVPFGPLTAGEYVITYNVTWRSAISDGYAQFGPGTPTTLETGRCTFVVQ